MNNLWRHRIFIFDFPDRERARREKIDACQKIELERICAKNRKCTFVENYLLEMVVKSILTRFPSNTLSSWIDFY